MLLYIVRHAWAEERDASRWPEDGLRPLTAAGQKRFAKMVKRLASAGFDPAVIATSPLLRCRQTAEVIGQRLPNQPNIVPLDALAPESDLAELLEWTARQQLESVAWVGHAPDVGQLAATLIGDGGTEIRFAKGAVAAIEFEDSFHSGGGQLLWLATAKLLGV